MRKILSLMIENSQESVKIPIFLIFSFALTYCLYRLIKRGGVFKYIPALVMMVYGLFALISGVFRLTKIEGLASVKYGVLALTVGILTFGFALILGMRYKNHGPYPPKKASHREDPHA